MSPAVAHHQVRQGCPTAVASQRRRQQNRSHTVSPSPKSCGSAPDPNRFPASTTGAYATRARQSTAAGPWRHRRQARAKTAPSRVSAARRAAGAEGEDQVARRAQRGQQEQQVVQPGGVEGEGGVAVAAVVRRHPARVPVPAFEQLPQGVRLQQVRLGVEQAHQVDVRQEDRRPGGEGDHEPHEQRRQPARRRAIPARSAGSERGGATPASSSGNPRGRRTIPIPLAASPPSQRAAAGRRDAPRTDVAARRRRR